MKKRWASRSYKDIPSYGSQSERAKITIHWFGAGYSDLIFQSERAKNIIHCFSIYTKKLPAFQTAKILTAFLILRKKKSIINIFNHVNTDWLVMSLLNTVIEKNIHACKTECEDRRVAG